MKSDLRWLWVAMAVPISLLGAGCEVGSADSTERQVGISVDGIYAGTLAGGRLTSRNSGAPVTQLNLRQAGAALEATDNNGIRFAGSINGETSTRAPFTLEGRTTAGAVVNVVGTINVSGTSASMIGSWVEPSLVGDVQASASVSTNAPPVTSLTLTPSGLINLTVGNSRSFSASGGSGSYTWSLGNSGLGSLSSSSGASVTYTASSAGSQTISVQSGGSSQSATITQN